MAGTLEHVFEVDILGRIADVWQEITKLQGVQRAYFEHVLVADLRPGGALKYVAAAGGKESIVGEILEIDPPRRLVHTFRFTELADAPSRVTYELRESAGVVHVTLTHDRFDGETDTFQRVVQGWPTILARLREVIEKGAPEGAVSDCPARTGE